MDSIVSLEMPADIVFARVATSAAETMAVSRGLARREAMRFQLVVEEFFTFLAQAAPEGRSLRVTLTGRPYQVAAEFVFQASSLNMGALNACSDASLDCDDASPDLGLIVAGRAADRFSIERDGESSFTLRAEVDKAYPALEAAPASVSPRPPLHATTERDPDMLLRAAMLATARYPAWHCPPSFKTPGKFVDKVLAGRFSHVAALDAAGNPAGLICWTRSGERGLSFFGPFVFTAAAEGAAVARMLMDGFLGEVARDDAEIVFSEHATDDMPEGYFESLGSLVRHDAAAGDDTQGGQCEQQVLYRHLREDMGATVWTDPALEAFQRDVYDRLAMCRDVLAAAPGTTAPRQHSLFSTMADAAKGLAVLRPLLGGEDVAKNLSAHIRALSDKGIENILLYLDLSRAWEAALAGPALEAGFAARLIIPHAGRSDVAVFQYASAR
ncbi:hypothetical protein dsx2_0628 [Desulfovibrio sp. X2]|uniref:hypothetical protein n=1 Tax=Desulfovibrio sp. X2 TaxID=941449 RepID=UPI0003587E8B|nr:hypothetical protein [Desulfovibrio sp. X2]EPR37696.1 hypothetical protein dsx2_0628 [Desulfovibrio sp. X2]